jgi:hypothetical protein
LQNAHLLGINIRNSEIPEITLFIPIDQHIRLTITDIGKKAPSWHSVCDCSMTSILEICGLRIGQRFKFVGADRVAGPTPPSVGLLALQAQWPL